MTYGAQTASSQQVDPQFLGGLVALLPSLIPPVIDIVRRLETQPNGFAQQSAPQQWANPMSAQSAGSEQAMDPQFFGKVLKWLPEIIPPLLNVVKRLEAPTPAANWQQAGTMSAQSAGTGYGNQQQAMDPQFFGAIFKALPVILPPILDVVRRLEAQPGSFGGQQAGTMSAQSAGTGGQQPQTMDPQFFGAILKALPVILPPILDVVKRLEAQPGSFGGQQGAGPALH